MPQETSRPSRRTSTCDSRHEDRPRLRRGNLADRTEGARPLPVDEWTYFHVRRCVQGILDQDATARAPDVDAVLDIALRRVQKGKSSVSSPDRYAGWVAVVCRNAYLNFIRTRRGFRAIHDCDAVDDPRIRAGYAHDAKVLRAALREAIDRLPGFLREVARLRFVENRSYPAIAASTGKAVPIVRSYVNKAANRLRDDRQLMRVLNDWRG